MSLNILPLILRSIFYVVAFASLKALVCLVALEMNKQRPTQ